MTALERLENRINELQVTAKKSLGQNFLVSDAVINKIISAALDFNIAEVVEVGPGCGALTDLLKDKFEILALVELDKIFAEFWRSKNFNVIEKDALQINWDFAKRKLLVSNLPYQISSSLVIERCLDVEQLAGMVLMFQKEVAQRIRAVAKNEHYGMLSVIAQEFWNIETVCDAGPRDFKPAPKVASRVLKFSPKKSEITNKLDYLKFVKACFQQRRRVLTTNLNSYNKHNELIEWLKLNKKTDKSRAEELSPAEIKNLFQYLKV